MLDDQIEIILPSLKFAFISNLVSIDSDLLPFKFSDEIEIGCATEQEQQKIKEAIIGFDPAVALGSVTKVYETERTPGDKSGFSASKTLPKNQWHYYVLRPSNDSASLTHSLSIKLHYAASVCMTPIDVQSLQFPAETGGYYGHPEILQKYFFARDTSKRKILTKDGLEQIKYVYSLIHPNVGGSPITEAFPEIQRGLEMLDSLNLLPFDSPFRMLGLFAIIEMLISHNPTLQDRGDSITHQIVSKMPLLFRRFDIPIDLECYFGKDAIPKKVWAALYGYRSAIAHGGKPDFDKDLKILKDEKNVREFLYSTTRSLLRNCMREPLLYRDLKAC